MDKSISIQSIAKALTAFQSEVPALSLDKEVEVTTKNGGKYKFKYATFGNIVHTAVPYLSKNGLSYSQLVEPDGSVTTLLMHESGEYISSTLTIKGDQTPQGIGSAISYAKRYSLSSILGMVAEDDDDANIAQGNSFNTAEDNRKWLNMGTDDYKNAVLKLGNGTVKLAEIEKHYKINKTTREKLLSEATNHVKPQTNDQK